MSEADGKASSTGFQKGLRKKLRPEIIAVSILVVMIIGTTALLIDRPTTHPSEHPSGYTMHTTIWIGGDSDFIPDNGVVGGNGTAADPYVIEGWYIESSVKWDGRMAGIEIVNANMHFTVRNCYISESASNRHWGIYLASCASGTLENNNCSANEYGIYLTLSSNIMIRNNTCLSNQLGIGLSGGGGNTLINNTCLYNGAGISLSSSRNSLMNNTCISNRMYGIRVQSSGDKNTLRNNTCSWNNGTGIEFTESSNNTVSNNTCSSNGGSGISLFWSCNNSYVSGNICNMNGQDGMNLYSSSYNVLIDNHFNSNNQSGVSLHNLVNGEYPCIANEIIRNEVSNNDGYAIEILSGFDNLVRGNAILYNNGVTSTYNKSRAQAYDDSSGNFWYVSEGTQTWGNYWNDLTVPDVNGDGIVDDPYMIAGNSGAIDRYPLTYNPM